MRHVYCSTKCSKKVEERILSNDLVVTYRSRSTRWQSKPLWSFRPYTLQIVCVRVLASQLRHHKIHICVYFLIEKSPIGIWNILTGVSDVVAAQLCHPQNAYRGPLSGDFWKKIPALRHIPRTNGLHNKISKFFSFFHFSSFFIRLWVTISAESSPEILQFVCVHCHGRTQGRRNGHLPPLKLGVRAKNF